MCRYYIQGIPLPLYVLSILDKYREWNLIMSFEKKEFMSWVNDWMFTLDLDFLHES